MINYPIELNVRPTPYPAIKNLHFTENDTGNELVITLQDRDGFRLQEEMSSTITYERSDGKTFLTNSSIDLENNSVVGLIPKEAVHLTGKGFISIQLYKDAKRITSLLLEYNVVRELAPDSEIEDSSEYIILFELISDVKSIKTDLDRFVIEDNIREENENIRVQNEVERQTSESDRRGNEVERVNNEDARISQELDRISNEANRKESESSRVASESNRESNEALRIDSETNRSSQESQRVLNENSRLSGESSRKDNEVIRLDNEANRQSNESLRVSGENDRELNESVRVGNESERQISESDRKGNEVVRVNNEDSRILSEGDRVSLYNLILQRLNDGEFVGEKGSTGDGLQYIWDGTSLGVKTESQSNYSYVDLKGEKGDIGPVGEKGDSGISVNIDGRFYFGVVDGDLIVYYPDGTTEPNFSINTSGELIYSV